MGPLYTGGVKIVLRHLHDCLPGADLAFFPRGGGFDPTTMRSIVHEPRSGEPISFAILNPRK